MGRCHLPAVKFPFIGNSLDGDGGADGIQSCWFFLNSQVVMPDVKSKKERSSRLREDDLEALLERGIVVLRKIGAGAFTPVYLVERRERKSRSGPATATQLALKMFDSAFYGKEYSQKFFPREMQILTQISHPHIIALDSILQRGEKVFILMRYAEGGDLFDYVQRNGAVPESLAQRWFLQLVSAFQYLHARDIAHRDLKCENILLSKNLNIKLADFGFARSCMGPNGVRELSRTYCGSAAYAAPEVVQAKAYNPKLADVWSLGVVLFVMLNAIMPFEDCSLSVLFKKQVLKKWHFNRRIRSSLSREVKHLIRALMEPDVTKRISLDGVSKHAWLTANLPPAGSGDAC